MKILPKFTLRQILIAMVGIAVVMACLGSAYRGSLLGLCLIASVISLSLPLLSLALVYWSLYAVRMLIERRRGKALIFLLALTAWGWEANPCLAQTLIPPGKKGFLVTIDDSYPVTDSGFLNLRVKLEKFPANPVKDAETFTVMVGDQYTQFGTRTVSRLTIKPGAASAIAELAIPQSNNRFRYLNLSIKRGIDDSPPGRGDLFSTYVHSAGVQNTETGMVWITSLANKDFGITHGVWDRRVSANATTQLHTAAGPLVEKIFDEADVFGTSSVSTSNSAISIREPRPIHPQNLPAAWLGISGVNMIFITLKELQQLTPNSSASLVLENWVAAGGTLVVFELSRNGVPLKDSTTASSNFERESLKQVMPALLEKTRVGQLEDWQDQWWQFNPQGKPSFSLDHFAGTVKTVGPNDFKSPALLTRELRRHWSPLEPQRVQELNDKFLMHALVLGRVIAVPNQFENWKNQDWDRLWNAVELSGDTLQVRLGDVDGQVDGLMSIPGVGKPPLKSFQVLMCLFVLVAGPGVFYFLKRAEQMQLFFFVVPILALASCLGILAYVILIEGFGSYGRTQTVTWIDHRCQTAVTQARSLYYHGLTPAPYRHGSEAVPMEFRTGSLIDFKSVQQDGEIYIRGGNILPRVPHRFVNLTSGQTDRWLRLEPVESADETEDGKKYRIQNQLGDDVAAALFRTERGWYLAEKIGAGQTVDAKIANLNGAKTEFSNLVRRLAPLDEPLWTTSGVDPRTESGLIENLRNPSTAMSLEDWMAPGTYLAILENFSEVESLLQDVEFKHRLHVVVGQW